MEFSNSFTVPADIDRVWSILLDASQVAPCVPGATLTESIDATHHKGIVKVKLGAVQMSYRGELEMDPDETNRVIVLRAKGTEQRGSGGASGTFTTRLSAAPDGGTKVDIDTKVDVTGRVAQFGRGIMQDVANRMIKDFASCLEQTLSAPAGDGSPSTTADESSAASNVAAPPTGGTEQAVAPSSPVSDVPPAPPTATATPSPAQTRSSPPSSAPRPTSPPPPSNELRLAPLIADLIRSRTAAALRALAERIEPR